jgi:nucleotide-binding universal stress UspA family protein
MSNSLFHVFRNTPFGRDTFLQSIYFSKQANIPLKVYVPQHSQFLMYFQRRAVTVDLSKYFLYDPNTAKQHAEALIAEHNVVASFLEPKDFTALSLPDVPVNHDYMCCPRSISDLSTKISLGYLGPKVRQIIQNASFPVLIPTPVFKEWKRMIVFFGGSSNAVKALQVALSIHKECGIPISLFTVGERKPQTYYQEILEKNNLWSTVQSIGAQWMFFKSGSLRKLLYEVPSDALVVIGAYGHSAIKEVLLGSKMETIQTVLPNNMLIIGPHC